MSKRVWKARAIVAAVVAVAAAIVVGYPRSRLVFGDGNVDVVCRETILVDKTTVSIEKIAFPNDLGRCAYVRQHNGKDVVVVDGVEGQEYDKAGRRDEKGFTLQQLPKMQIPPYTSLCISFSGDGKHFAYIAARRNKQLFVIDGVEGPEYDEVGSPLWDRSQAWLAAYKWQGGGIEFGPVFSPDGGHVAYRARRADKWYMVVDGVESGPYEQITDQYNPVYGKDGAHIAYSARRGSQWLVVRDGVEGRPYDEVLFNGLTFSDDGRHLAYAARLEDRWFVVEDGLERKEYDKISWRPSYSPEGDHIAYVARVGNKEFGVVDGVEGKAYDFVYLFALGPQGTLKPYLAIDHWGSAQPYLVVTDGVERRLRGSGVRGRLSNDGKRIALKMNTGDNQKRVFIDGVEGPLFGAIYGHPVSGDPVFSPDSKHVFYVGTPTRSLLARGKEFINRRLRRSLFDVRVIPKYVVVVDGVKGGVYDSVGFIAISRDGKHLLYTATRSGKSFVVVDRIEHPSPGPDSSAMPHVAGPFGECDLRFLTERDGKPVRVDVTLAGKRNP